MGILNWLGVGKDLAEPINAIGTLYTTDKEKLEAEKNLKEIVQKPILSQLDINKVLAQSQVLFNSGWQPLMGWTCGFLILIYYAPQIIIATYVWGSHAILSGVVPPFPIRSDDILNLVYLLFGFGLHSMFRNKK